MPLDLGLSSPAQDRIAGQLGPIVADDRFRLAARDDRLRQRLRPNNEMSPTAASDSRVQSS